MLPPVHLGLQTASLCRCQLDPRDELCSGQWAPEQLESKDTLGRWETREGQALGTGAPRAPGPKAGEVSPFKKENQIWAGTVAQ